MRTNKLFILIAALLVISLLAACGPAATDEPAAPEEPAPVEEVSEPEEEVAEPVEEVAEPEEEVMDPVTIQVFYPVAVDAPIAAILNGYIDDFQDEYPHITVEPVFSGGYGDVQTAIQTTIDGGGEPPALGVMLATSLYDLINADYIVPLDAYISGMEDGKAYVDDFLPAFLANSYYDDQLWSIPFWNNLMIL